MRLVNHFFLFIHKFFFKCIANYFNNYLINITIKKYNKQVIRCPKKTAVINQNLTLLKNRKIKKLYNIWSYYTKRKVFGVKRYLMLHSDIFVSFKRHMYFTSFSLLNNF